MKTPKLPSVKSLNGRALALLLQGEQITHRDFQNHAATYRLSAVIHPLRKNGWPIVDQWERGKTIDKTGRYAKYKRYFISEDLLKELRLQMGVRIKRFISTVQRFEAGVEAATPNQTNNNSHKLPKDYNNSTKGIHDE